MINQAKLFYQRISIGVYSPYADIFLGFCFFIESLLFFPAEPLLLLYCNERKDRQVHYLIIATFCSVLGGVALWYFGYWVRKNAATNIFYYLSYIIKKESFDYLCDLFKKNVWSSLFIACFPPIPYKAVSITAGFCNISLIPFVIVSFIMRWFKFFLLAKAVQHYKEIKKFSLNHVYTIGAIAIIIIALLYFISNKS